jgi:hypothetical protein
MVSQAKEAYKDSTKLGKIVMQIPTAGHTVECDDDDKLCLVRDPGT